MFKLTSKLAVSNLIKNRRLYYPFALVASLVVAISYLFNSLAFNPHLDNLRGGDSMRTVLLLGIFIVMIAETIIVLYANSFVMKNRSKELGLYGMLGMTKGHLFVMTIKELLLFCGLTALSGLGLGLLLDQLIYAFLLKLMKVKVELVSTFQPGILFLVLAIYGLIFGLLILINGIRLWRLNPLQMSREKASGEKKSRFLGLQTLLGLGSLGAGYYLALSVQDALSAITTFFLAVLLVILGTYLLFNAGVTVFLTWLKKREGYYYQPKNMISVSNLIYRMKKNAVGLATISILSTMVLVTLTGGINIYAESEWFQKVMNPHDMAVTGRDVDKAQLEQFLTDFANSEHLPIKKQTVSEFYSFALKEQDGNKLTLYEKGQSNVVPPIIGLVFSEADYAQMTGENLNLTNQEVALYAKNVELSDQEPLQFAGQNLSIVKRLNPGFTEGNVPDNYSIISQHIFYLVVKDPDSLLGGLTDSLAVFKEHYGGLDVEASYEEQLTLVASYDQAIDTFNQTQQDGAYIYGSIKADAIQGINTLIGGIFFIGIFLSLVFILGTVLVIYYKQISEGYEDRERFVILQNVGLDEKQTKQTIRKQVLTVFFLPLLFAFLHLSFAYHMLGLILQVLGVLNAELMLMVTLSICGIFLLFYVLVFLITSRSYRKIVSL